jgi:hypothetical protein
VPFGKFSVVIVGSALATPAETNSKAIDAKTKRMRSIVAKIAESRGEVRFRIW